MSALRLLGVFMRLGVLSELAYRANFWIQLVESAVTVVSSVGLLWVVTLQTPTLAGWHGPELLVVMGVYFLVFGLINAMLSPSLSQFMEDVRQGTLDYTLTKPADAQLLVSISHFQPWKAVDVGLGALLLTIAIPRLSHPVTLTDAGLFALMLGFGLTLVYSFWIVLATLAFWFIRIENILQIFWMVYNAGRWPVGIYPGWLRLVLTAVVPVAFAITVPAEALTGRLTLGTAALTATLAGVSLVLSRVFWRFGLRHYGGASA